MWYTLQSWLKIICIILYFIQYYPILSYTIAIALGSVGIYNKENVTEGECCQKWCRIEIQDKIFPFLLISSWILLFLRNIWLFWGF